MKTPTATSGRLACSKVREARLGYFELAIPGPQDAVVGEISQEMRDTASRASPRNALQITNRMGQHRDYIDYHSSRGSVACDEVSPP